MLVIGNTCVGGWIYVIVKQKYNNPFIWCEIDGKNFLNLIVNFNTIDFKKRRLITVGLEKIKCRKVFAIEIDSQVVVSFPHHIKDETFKAPTKCKSDYIGWDMRYEKMEEYLLEKYDQRLERMLKRKETPIFIVDTSVTEKEEAEKIEKCNVEKIYSIYKNNYEPIDNDTKAVHIGEIATKGRAQKIIEKYGEYIHNTK